MARCGNCGLELLGSMKKCPKCGYDLSTGQIDNNYLEKLNKSRENSKIIYCDGWFSDNGGRGNTCEIRIFNDKVLRVCKFKRDNVGRRATRAAFGLMGTLIYDAVHEEDCAFEVKLDDIVSIKQSNNPSFTDGWTVYTKDGRSADMKFDQPVSGFLEMALDGRFNLSEGTISVTTPYSTQEKKFLCKSCGTYHTGWYQTCPTCGAVGTMEKVKRQENHKQPEPSAASIQAKPMFTLYGVTGAFAGAAIPVKGTLPVGTYEGNRILYPKGTQGISRRHCIITAKDSGVFISDCGSSYGTWINNTIRLQKNQEIELHKGDKISLGSNQESFILEISK